MNVAHNSKRNKRDTTRQDGDDYVYPTAKIRETKTRSRRDDADLIEAGLIEHENLDPNTGEEEWYSDEPMVSQDEDEEDQAVLDDLDDEDIDDDFYTFDPFDGYDHDDY